MQLIKKFLKDIEPREYQADIYQTCKDKNCLVVLPTGTGKTLISLMLTIERMTKHPEGKVLFLAPTRPLAMQHLAYFKKHLPELFGTIELFTGKVKDEKRKEIWQNADIVFSTPQCIDEETFIFTEEGPIKISEFFKKLNFEEKKYSNKIVKVAEIKEKVLGYDGENIKFLEASKALKLDTNKLIKIKTEIGNSLICTEDHPLLTINQNGDIFWKEARLLNKGDYVASAKEINIEEKPISIIKLLSEDESLKVADKNITKKLIKKLKENKIKCSAYSRYYYNFMPLKLFLELAKKINFNYGPLTLTDSCGRSEPIKIPDKIDFKVAYIIGAMLGDGHIGNRRGHGSEVVFSDIDRESVCNEFQKVIYDVFGVKMKKDKTKGIVTYNSALAKVLTNLGVPAGRKAKHIRVPKFILFGNKELTRGFIKGIFDTDGHAARYGVSISSISERFIQDLKWAFLKIGIIGNIEKRKSKGMIKGRVITGSNLFSFRFCGRKNIQKFLETLPDKDKCKKIIETLDSTKRPETRSKEILPIIELMKKIRKTNMSKADYYRFSCLSLDNLRKLSENLEGKEALKLKKLLNLPLRWTKIKEKEEINEKKEVYDLTIENAHNFITNGIVSHNCISNDIKNNLYNLNDISLLVVDECHRCIKNYAYTFVANQYKEQAKNQRILGLTASPGHEKPKIKKILNNLGIEAVEIRTRKSEDVEEYLQDLKFQIEKLDFPPEFMEIRELLKKLFDKKISELQNRKLLFMPPTKKFLLELQYRIMKAIASGNKNFNLFLGASACAQVIKIQHALELLETQTLASFQAYMLDLFEQAKQEKSKAVKQLVKQKEFNLAYTKLTDLLAKKIEHPKVQKLKEIIQEEIKNNAKSKIIVFAQFRDTIVKLCKELNSIENIRARVFVGQAKKGLGKDETGMNQKEQKELIDEFSLGKINVVVSSSIGEEGLDIPETTAVIFYEPIPSAIRTIQRRGRTARMSPGKLIILVTKKTRDESYYWSAFHKEKQMHKAIDDIKRDFENEQNSKDKNTNQNNKQDDKEKQKSLF